MKIPHTSETGPRDPSAGTDLSTSFLILASMVPEGAGKHPKEEGNQQSHPATMPRNHINRQHGTTNPPDGLAAHIPWW